MATKKDLNKNIFNRELSWLAFNHSVLQEAADKSVPLVERLRFLGIFSNNLDEFFRVRVASVKRIVELNIDNHKLTEGSPKTLLNNIQKTVIKLHQDFDNIFEDILKGFEKEGVFFINENQINETQQKFIDEFYNEKILPVLAPIMLNNIVTFPPLKDKSIYLAIKLSDGKKSEFALIELPMKSVSRFIELPREGNKRYMILLDDIIRIKLKDIFLKFPYTIFEAYTIKLTRDAELDIDNDLTKSFLEKISKGVQGRKRGQPVRMVYDKNIPKDLLQHIKSRLKFDDEDTLIPGGRYHNFKDFMNFPGLGNRKFEYKKLPSLRHPAFNPGISSIDYIFNKDVLLFYPYHKFSHFISLIREAAIDPDVSSIRITLYRVARVSLVLNALINACLNGKLVTVVIELQARFDEESNIYWSRKLEEAGAKVLFGIPGLKIHAKLLLIGRKTKRKKTEYIAGVSTGNFHEGNAKVYSDVSLFTADKQITREVKSVFNLIEFPYKPVMFRQLHVAPVFMRRRLYGLVDNEINNVKAGKPAYIILKINNLVDKKMISKIYEASQAGVSITLIVRGICSLKPGVKGLSENIKAFSIVGRFLEHSRIFIFCNNGDELHYISSADWMPRNFDHRIEVGCPVKDPELQSQLRNLINLLLTDNIKARVINDVQDNQYIRTDGKEVNSQIELYNLLKNNKL